LLVDAIFKKKIAGKREGKIRIYLRSQKRDLPMTDGSLSGFRWPLVSLQCDHTPCVSATGFSRSFGFQIAEMRKIAFQLFNGPDRALIGRSRSYRDIANRDFAISDVEVLCLLGFAIADFPMACFLSGLFPISLIAATCPSKRTVVISPRDFAK
jgi:hypothetical protein